MRAAHCASSLHGTTSSSSWQRVPTMPVASHAAAGIAPCRRNHAGGSSSSSSSSSLRAAVPSRSHRRPCALQPSAAAAAAATAGWGATARRSPRRPASLAAAGGSSSRSSASASLQGSVDPGYLAAAAYLAELGFTNKTEIARVLDIAMNPASLFVTGSGANASARPLDVAADIAPVVEFLRGRGLGAGDLVKVIGGHPPVLSYSVPQRLQPFWDYLASVGVPDVGAAVVRRPSLLGLTVDGSLVKIIDYLTYVGTDKEKIVEYICTSI